MKVGDKVYCKKRLSYLDVLFFIKNKIYVIIEIYEDGNIIISDERSKTSHFSIYTPNDDEYKFIDHFYTEKEHRKLKLKKLNGKSYL